jgi:hypothetical protein
MFDGDTDVSHAWVHGGKSVTGFASMRHGVTQP